MAPKTLPGALISSVTVPYAASLLDEYFDVSSLAQVNPNCSGWMPSCFRIHHFFESQQFIFIFIYFWLKF